jgi:hypothetical protein
MSSRAPETKHHRISEPQTGVFLFLLLLLLLLLYSTSPHPHEARTTETRPASRNELRWLPPPPPPPPPPPSNILSADGTSPRAVATGNVIEFVNASMVRSPINAAPPSPHTVPLPLPTTTRRQHRSPQETTARAPTLSLTHPKTPNPPLPPRASQACAPDTNESTNSGKSVS